MSGSSLSHWGFPGRISVLLEGQVVSFPPPSIWRPIVYLLAQRECLGPRGLTYIDGWVLFFRLRVAGSLGLIHLGTWGVGFPSRVAPDLVLAPALTVEARPAWARGCGQHVEEAPSLVTLSFCQEGTVWPLVQNGPAHLLLTP